LNERAGALSSLLMQAYCRLDNADEALQVAQLALQLLEDSSLRMLDRKAMLEAAPNATSAATLPSVKSGKGANTTSRATLQSVASSRASTGATRKTSTKGSALVMEASQPNVAAYVTVMRAYVVLTLQTAEQTIADGGDPRPLYVEMCDRLTRCADLVADVTGEGSSLVAEVLTLRVAAATDFLLAFHQRCSGLVTPVDAYTAWIADNLQLTQEYAIRVVALNQHLAQSIPQNELSYTTEKPFTPEQLAADEAAYYAAAAAAAAPAPAPTAPPGKGAAAAAPAPVAPVVEEPVVPPEPWKPPKLNYKVVSNPVTRRLALSQLQLAYLHVLQAVHLGEHISTTVNFALNEMRALAVMTAVERYLYETRPRPSTEFVETRLMKAGQLLGECVRHLSNPESPGVIAPSVPVEVLMDVTLLRDAAAMLQMHKDGVYDCMWGDPMPIPPPTITVTDTEEQTITGAVQQPAVAAPADPKAKAAPAAPAAAAAPAAGGRKASTAVVLEAAPPEPQMTQVGDQILSEDASAARTALTEASRAMTVRCSSLLAGAGAATAGVAEAAPSLRFLHYACIALVEAYGKHRSATAAMWLMQLQSAQAAVWLRTVWRDFALNPTSAVAGAVSRLESLCGRAWPIKAALQQIAAEQDFLSAASVAFKRYVTRADFHSLGVCLALKLPM
jgi:hypothetical protein